MATNAHPTTTVQTDDAEDEHEPLGMAHLTVVPTNFRETVEE